MSMESFYGGRQGASFVIVKQFDMIKRPQDGGDVYKKKTFALFENFGTDSEDVFVYPFVEKTVSNYKDYKHWKTVYCNGVQVKCKQSEEQLSTENHNLPEIEAEVMVDCFAGGVDTLSEVNYGEYVIIDANDLNDFDNGKIFRRGLDKNGDDPLHGAEYIGQVQGPQGEKGENGGIHILGNVTNASDLSRLTPETFVSSKPANSEHAGWGVTVGPGDSNNPVYKLYLYDYKRNVWYEYGPLLEVKPRIIINAFEDKMNSESQSEIDDCIRRYQELMVDGFWLPEKPLNYEPYY